MYDGLGKGPYACLPCMAWADAAAVLLLYVLPALVKGGKEKGKRE